MVCKAQILRGMLCYSVQLLKAGLSLKRVLSQLGETHGRREVEVSLDEHSDHSGSLAYDPTEFGERDVVTLKF